MLHLLLLCTGLVGLWLGTELTVRTTIELGRRRGLSQSFLGLTVLAVGTDLPELVVAVNGGLHQLRGIEASGVVLGNAVGSAITQGTLVLGIAGLFGYLRIAPRMIRRDGPVLILSSVLLALLALDGRLNRIEGGALLIAYAIYYVVLVQAERGRSRPPETGGDTWRQVLAIGAGLFGVVLSAELVVRHALFLATERGWDQTLIGVLLVGAGTSLPELALSVGAAAKGRAGLSVGNVIGSNIFDLLVPIGLSGLIHPLTVERATLTIDLPVVVLVSVLGLAFFVRRRGLQRRESIALIVVYVLFCALRLGMA